MLRDGTNTTIHRSVTNCLQCLAWGLTYSQGVCVGCYQMAKFYKVESDCDACGRFALLKRGYCRLCWAQAYLERTTGTDTPLLCWVREVRHQQLFFAIPQRRQAKPKAFPRRRGAKGRPLKLAPPIVGRPIVGGVQLRLFDLPRSYVWGACDMRHGVVPDNDWLKWALHLVQLMVERRGINAGIQRGLNRTLTMLLAGYQPGDMIRVSEFRAVLDGHCVNLAQVIEILDTMEVVVDDRVLTFDHWVDEKLSGLRSSIADDARRWTYAIRDGTERCRPHSPDTAHGYLFAVFPALAQWAVDYEYLRQVTRADVIVYLEQQNGQQRQFTAGAFRSLFGWAKRNGVVFKNPAARLPPIRIEHAIWQPLTAEQLAQTIKAATTPQCKLWVILAAVHAASPKEIRATQLDDIDFARGTLTIANKTHPLDDLTRDAVVAWLEHRQTQWPNTANLHLFVNSTTALHLGPVSATWIINLRGLAGTIDRLRIDRQLDEALANHADPLHIASVFDIHPSTAIRYADSARQLLASPHEINPSASR